VVRLAINVLGDRRRERLAAAVYLLRLEFRQPKLASHIITARDRIVASAAVHHEPVPRGAIELDRKRTIGCAVSRSRCEHFTVDHIAAKSLGEFLRRDHSVRLVRGSFEAQSVRLSNLVGLACRVGGRGPPRFSGHHPRRAFDSGSLISAGGSSLKTLSMISESTKVFVPHSWKRGGVAAAFGWRFGLPMP